jgi:hypothetical protein
MSWRLFGSKGQSGAIAPSLDTSCTNRTANNTAFKKLYSPPPHHDVGVGVDVAEVVDAEQLLRAPRQQPLAVLREAHGLDDVLVLEAVQLVARDGVPQPGAEVRGGGGAVL